MTDIVKEAIADAKQLREGAIENAKAMLQEQFMPKLEKMIEEQLSEEDDELELEEAWDEEDLEETVDMEDDEDEDLELESMLSEMEDDEDEDFEMTETELNELLEEMDDEDEDLELESMLAEMEDDEDEDLELESMLAEMEDDEDEDLDISEAELRSLVSSIMEAEDEEDEVEDEDEEDFDLDSLGLDLDDDSEVDVDCKCNAVKEENVKLHRKNGKLTKDLKEAYDAIKLMKDKINEVNLMNSKLLYTNKLFNNESLNLTEKQKLAILETFDKATTLNEVKLVYSTFTSKLNTVTESTKKIKGFASDTIAEQKAAIRSVDSISNRWQALAGMKSAYE